MVKAWNAEHPDEEITAQEIPAGKTSEEVIGAAITAGNAPCLVFNTSPAAVPQFQKQGGLVALDTFEGGTDYVEERSGDVAEQYQSPDGQYYQIPWKSNPVMIFYNKDLMKKAGVDPENPPLATHDEFLETSRKIVDSGAAEAAIWPAPTSEFFQSWFDFYPLYAAETGGTAAGRGRRGDLRLRRGQEPSPTFWEHDVRRGARPEGGLQRRLLRRPEGRDVDRRPLGDRGLRRGRQLGRRPGPDLRRHQPGGDLHLLRREEHRALLGLREPGHRVGGPEVRDQRGAGRQAAGDDRPDAAAHGPAGHLPGLLQGEPGVRRLRRPGHRAPSRCPTSPNSIEIWQTFRDAYSSVGDLRQDLGRRRAVGTRPTRSPSSPVSPEPEPDDDERPDATEPGPRTGALRRAPARGWRPCWAASPWGSCSPRRTRCSSSWCSPTRSGWRCG